MNYAKGSNRSFNYTPAKDIAAGDIVIAGGLIGITPYSIKAGETGTVDRFREVEVPYDGAADAAQGATAYWKDGKATAASSGAVEIGYFAAGVTSKNATCSILLK